jgi:hypothetical protein
MTGETKMDNVPLLVSLFPFVVSVTAAVPTIDPCYKYLYEFPVAIGSACNYVILAKTGITNVITSAVTGNIAVSPITYAAMTGFALTMDSSTQFSTSSQVTGKAFASDYGVPTRANLTTAVSDMQTAYTKASQRPRFDAGRQNIGGGTIGGETLFPGFYTFTAAITINSDITFEGGPNDVFIIQTTGTITQAANTKVLLSSCAQAKNIFWQSAGYVSIGAGAQMQGTLLVKEKAVFGTGSSLLGSVLAQTAFTLKMTTITPSGDTCTTR